MKQLNWKQASHKQLYEIAYIDKQCHPRYKREAAAEILRRLSKRKLSGKPIARQYAR